MIICFEWTNMVVIMINSYTLSLTMSCRGAQYHCGANSLRDQRQPHASKLVSCGLKLVPVGRQAS